MSEAAAIPVSQSRRSSSNGNGKVWMFLCTHLATILFTGLVAWFAFGGGLNQNQVDARIDEKIDLIVYRLEQIEKKLP